MTAVAGRLRNLGKTGREAETRELMRLAAEALLVHGSNCNGLSRPDGCNRVALDGVELRLSDFGIEGVSA